MENDEKQLYAVAGMQIAYEDVLLRLTNVLKSLETELAKTDVLTEEDKNELTNILSLVETQAEYLTNIIGVCQNIIDQYHGMKEKEETDVNVH